MATLPPNNPLAGLTVDAAIKHIEGFQSIFLPTGGLWISITQSKQVRAVIEAKCDPEKIYELLSKDKIPSDIKLKMQGDTLRISVKRFPFPIEIKKTGIIIGSIPTKKSELNKNWNIFVNRAGKPGQRAVIEVDTSFLASFNAKRPKRNSSATSVCTSNMRVLNGAMEMYNMDAKAGEEMNSLNMVKLAGGGYLGKQQPRCIGGGEYSTANEQISCSVHNTVKNIKNNENVVLKQSPSSKQKTIKEYALEIIRARILFDQKALTVAVALKADESRTYLKSQLENLLAMAKQTLKTGKTAGDSDVQASADLLSKIKVFNKSPWMGIRYSGNETELAFALTAVTGIVATIAIPNFQKAGENARAQACFAN